MESSLGLLLVLIATLAIIHLVQAQSQQGFISLDCGLPANELSPYNESSTELQFYSDATLIQSGKPGRIQKSLEGEYLKPTWTLRYFPDGKRNCYNLKVEKGRKHLIRAWFLYGNYDGHNIGPKFDLYLGPNPWATIDLEKQVNGTVEEILHIPTLDSLQICLVKTGETTPMISTLEIRPMGSNNLYAPESGSLKVYARIYIGESETNTIRGSFVRTQMKCHQKMAKAQRYPDDAYDRQWSPYFQPEWTQISTTSDVVNTNAYDLPKVALASVAIPTNASEPLTIAWTNSDYPDAQYYLFVHFAEIQELKTNETREINMLWNEKVISNPIIPKRLAIYTSEGIYPRDCSRGDCSFQLTRTNGSTLPPLLNAFEVFTVIQFPQSDTDENDVVAITSIKDAYVFNNNWQGDPCVPQNLKWEGLSCSNTPVSTPPRITSLNLSSTNLTGTIAAAIQNLTQLEKLDLSNNNLIGELPEFLGNIKSLLFINLSGNDLNGSIPQALQKKGLELLVEGNPRLCLSDSCRKSHKKTFLVPIVASVASAGIVIAVLVIFLLLRKKKSTIVEGQHLPPRTSTVNNTFANKNSKRFTHSEVLKMTNNFQKILGKGGFGMVYHGTVNGSEQLAVKVLSQSSTQGYKEFKAEVDLLLRVHHINLVSLVGYCHEGDHLALIYEFLPNGDLKQHLSEAGGKFVINWSSRLRIALEAALGLEYLHIGCKPPMVHRDVKTANILLDENFMAKLADFGLSRSFQGGAEAQDSTVIAGTLGYLDPEYNHSGRLGEKSDVYSFGIVLLEMITNQPVINRASANSHITQWVGSKVNRGDITEIMDPNLHNDYDSNSAWRALELAMTCANPSSSKRPTMSQVIHELKECIVCENWGISKNRGLESEEMNVSLDTSVVPMAR